MPTNAARPSGAGCSDPTPSRSPSSEFGRLGAEVLVRPSPWRLGAAQAEPGGGVVHRMGGCCVRAAGRAGRREPSDYTRRRLAQAAAGRARGHRRPRRPAGPARIDGVDAVSRSETAARARSAAAPRRRSGGPRRASRAGRGSMGNGRRSRTVVARESPTKKGATTSCSSSTRLSVRNWVCTLPPPSTISRCTPRAPRSSLRRRILTRWPPSTTVATVSESRAGVDRRAGSRSTRASRRRRW